MRCLKNLIAQLSVNKIYIKNPVPSDFDIQRRDFHSKRLLTRKKLEMSFGHVFPSMKMVRLKLIWVLNGGFLPQDLTKDPNNHGLPCEIGEVDEFGNPFKNESIQSI